MLFQIDPAPLQAALDAAEAALAQAEAQPPTRTSPHSATGSWSRAGSCRARTWTTLKPPSVRPRPPSNRRRRTSRPRASISAMRASRSPIAGRAGQQRVTEGALVGQGEATLLTTVEQLDPIYVNFDQPAVELERLRREQSSGNITLAGDNKAVVQLNMQDGPPTRSTGTLDFADVSVDPATGAVALRGIVPNPDGQLLPGMYVNVRLTVGTMNNAYLVPQAACSATARAPTSSPSEPTTRSLQKRVVDGHRAQERLGRDQRTRGRRPDHRLRHPERAARLAGDRRRELGRATARPRLRATLPLRGSLDAHAAVFHRPARSSPGCSRSSSTLGGVIAIRALPAEAYPDIAPPQVIVSATYPGANAEHRRIAPSRRSSSSSSPASTACCISPRRRAPTAARRSR